MAKRKRNRQAAHGCGSDYKRQRTLAPLTTGKNSGGAINQPVLVQYYPQVLSLRQYLISKLPSTSRIRRKKILSIGAKARPDGKDETQFSSFLDQTLVGHRKLENIFEDERLQQWATFTQRADTSDSGFANLTVSGIYSQSDIVDFAIWLLFHKATGPNGRVQHLLCQGYRKGLNARTVNQDDNPSTTIPGIISTHPNSHVSSMKELPWTRVLALMGREGEKAMIDLLIDCGIFVAIEAGIGTYHQLSGQPLGDLQVLGEKDLNPTITILRNKAPKSMSTPFHTPSSISFVRNRMLYARAALNAQGGVRFSLRHIHVLNRYPYPKENPKAPDESTIRVMMYIFPRQFGLHNVFTHNVDSRETVQPQKDYTLREDEINEKYTSSSTPKIPKRLRGKITSLIVKLQTLHAKCAYKKLLDYYCPAMHKNARFPVLNTQPQKASSSESGNGFITQMTASTAQTMDITLSNSTSLIPRKLSMMDHATPDAMVSAFCRATLSNHVIPQEFWGSGHERTHNMHVFNRNVDRFIKSRRFESLTLHEVSQGMKITSLAWLNTPCSTGRKLSQSDVQKRWELFREFVYYVFDSLLIPLIRSNFHVTESNVHKYRLFYFRHDVWRALSEPAITSLKITMFEEVKLAQALRILDSRSLGFSQVRLLPKETGVRPIMNLRRRTLKKGSKNVLGSSINSVLTPVYNALTFEKNSDPSRLGSSLFSVGDLYTRLKAFKSTLSSTHGPLYFAKVDVKTAFDTIPQAAIVQLIASLPTQTSYRIARHVEIKPGDTKPLRKWSALAHSPNSVQSFASQLLSGLAAGKKNTVFVESVVNHLRSTDEIMNLLNEHITQNLVKIGKKFYRQKNGIPQGSMLSSLLCNYFYADLESHHLSFLRCGENLLLRLIDDFLLITTNRTHAKKFLEVMHAGVPEYSVNVNPDKTLANFEVVINERKVERLIGTRAFPYCGNFIDTGSLNITKDRERQRDTAIADSMTIEFSKRPGKSFHRKVLNSFKIQAHAMFFDTAHNSLPTVHNNIYTAFRESALKLWTYARCLPTGKQPGTKLLIKTIGDLANLAFVLTKSNGRSRKNHGYKCAISKVQVEWLALNAFKYVLARKQAKYGKVLEWIDERIVRYAGNASCRRTWRREPNNVPASDQ